MKKRVAILGSTGSIGTQALEVIQTQTEAFEVEVLTAHSNADLLIAQAIAFQPNAVVITQENLYEQVRDALETHPIKVYAGMNAVNGVVQMDTVDIVLTAMVGYAGLQPTIKAIEAGKTIALANKETLVVAGQLITQLAREKGVNIYPVDSEHSAIFQCLAGEFHNPIEKIVLTASGGPFRGRSWEYLQTVTRAQALKHPNWEMGAKITIDSASLMNKGLEVIEAKWLFGLQNDQIEVVVHPQSIVHSLVQFQDGSLKAQMGLPDMKLPIQYALSYPDRLKTNYPRFNFLDYPQLTFEKPDLETFRNLGLAFEAMERGGNAPCILNAANEVAVAAFLREEVGFLEMSDLISDCLAKVAYIAEPSLDDFVQTDREARQLALSLMQA
ncbi:1-deoxy-D-xylulose-5-phosphate reductoisomerase [Rufibacter hautae]|uniref:1-deoxy-D-xylulose 5-phosphate reductoisomerase n=1 Tax=Rufibacter hautae TaxID=2595005 RepID=A0A5B6TIP7_9BACT|nr:1-deoxy-D-xylulose-5-phosphate reductoisomerase [Rufibacter hautae]KAA3439327.1 1-deoxy-D-xylulose-5-phosphate reductoisomerase [Rufibacter hautae]